MKKQFRSSPLNVDVTVLQINDTFKETEESAEKLVKSIDIGTETVTINFQQVGTGAKGILSISSEAKVFLV